MYMYMYVELSIQVLYSHTVFEIQREGTIVYSCTCTCVPVNML